MELELRDMENIKEFMVIHHKLPDQDMEFRA